MLYRVRQPFIDGFLAVVNLKFDVEMRQMRMDRAWGYV